MNVLKNIRFILPLFFLVAVVIVLWRGLSLHPAEVPSPLINKAVPIFELSTLDNSNRVTQKVFMGHVTLFNVWATWCAACAEEHEFLLHLAQDEHIRLIGLDYKDDEATAKALLKKQGNPYKINLIDPQGLAALDWGVYGTPETFVIDKKGTIRYKQIGPLTPEIWESTVKPLVIKLEEEVG